MNELFKSLRTFSRRDIEPKKKKIELFIHKELIQLHSIYNVSSVVEDIRKDKFDRFCVRGVEHCCGYYGVGLRESPRYRFHEGLHPEREIVQFAEVR